VRSSSLEVLGSEECIILSDSTVRNIFLDGGIDIDVCVYPRRSTMADGSENSFSTSSREHHSAVLRRLGYR